MSHQPTLESKAAEVYRNLNNVGYAFDPTAIIAIITAIVQLFKDCSLTPAQAEKRASSPRLLDRIRLRRLIRENTSGNDMEALEAALMDMGEDLTRGEMKSMYEESVLAHEEEH